MKYFHYKTSNRYNPYLSRESFVANLSKCLNYNTNQVNVKPITNFVIIKDIILWCMELEKTQDGIVNHSSLMSLALVSKDWYNIVSKLPKSIKYNENFDGDISDHDHFFSNLSKPFSLYKFENIERLSIGWNTPNHINISDKIINFINKFMDKGSSLKNVGLLVYDRNFFNLRIFTLVDKVCQVIQKTNPQVEMEAIFDLIYEKYTFEFHTYEISGKTYYLGYYIAANNELLHGNLTYRKLNMNYAFPIFFFENFNQVLSLIEASS